MFNNIINIFMHDPFGIDRGANTLLAELSPYMTGVSACTYVMHILYYCIYILCMYIHKNTSSRNPLKGRQRLKLLYFLS